MIDKHGRQLLDLCKSTGFVIANGRLGTDKDIGQWTYAGNNGCSVLDYCIIKPNDFKHIVDFGILPFTDFSDHVPILLKIRCRDREPDSNLPTVTLHVCFGAQVSTIIQTRCINNPILQDTSSHSVTVDSENNKLVWNVDCVDKFRQDLFQDGERLANMLDKL